MMMMQYSVRLASWPELPVRERIAAEVRYAVELERAFGTPEQVCVALLEARDAVRQAERAAQVAGWRGLPDRPADAAFQLSVEK